MSALTEDQQRAFIDRVVGIYKEPETATAVAASNKGLDPIKRLGVLTPLYTAASKAESAQSMATAALRSATTASVAATDAAYAEASEAADALISELGDKHPISQKVRKIRGEMTNPAARGPSAPKTTP